MPPRLLNVGSWGPLATGVDQTPRRKLRTVSSLLVALASGWASGTVLAQAPPAVDTLPAGVSATVDTLAAVDTLPVSDTLAAADTLAMSDALAAVDSSGPALVYRVSPDALTATVEYKMRDSMHYSVAEEKIRLYREAEVNYTDITLGAGYMEIDYGADLVEAEPIVDSVGVEVERPSFAQGSQAFTAQGIRYNFDTRKGIITNAVTQQGDLYVLGGKTKLVAADERDPRRADNVVYNADAIITTCELDHPHYGIRSSKQKFIPGKQVIVGPSNVELGGVPTPLWLPFGFFPVGSAERSGLIFPSDYTYTELDGFGFQGVGWYFPFNDKIHTALSTDLFLKGTLRADVTTDYSNRYKYRGNFNLNIARNRLEALGVESFTNSGSLRWNHTQDPKAHPYRTFSANVSFSTNLNERRNNASAFAQTRNTQSSAINYAVRFPRHPSWNLSASAQQSQNFATRAVTIRPQVQFRTGQINPFSRAGNSRSWYRKATVDYSASVLGNIRATDETVFDGQPYRDGLYGGQHQVRLSAPVNVLKYFRLDPNVSYQESYYLDRRFREFVTVVDTLRDTLFIEGDTIVTEDLQSRVLPTPSDTTVDAGGFNVARSFRAALSLSTQVYGTARFRLGPLRGVRHIITPSISTGYQPDYSRSPFDYYEDLVNPISGEVTTYLRFPNQPFSPGSLPAQESFNVSYRLGNRIETKLRSRTDSTDNVSTLVNGLNFSGSYNPGADSLRWSPVTVSGAQLSLFRKIVRVNLQGLTLGVYELNEAGRPVDRTLASAGRFPFRIDRFGYSVSAGLTLAQARELVVGTEAPLPPNSIYNLISRFNISYNFSRTFTRQLGWSNGANTVNVSGPLPITDKWSIRSITIGYDFERERITYPTLSLGRDLHCWEMDFFWSPAFNNQFTFSIRVKPSSLGFLNVPYRRGSAR